MKSNPGLVKFYSNKIEDREVEDVLSSFPELNNGANGLYNITALQIAAAYTKKGVTSTIKRLLMCEDVNRGDQLGRTPLHYAVMNGNSELVELLLNSGADPECKFLYLCTLRISREDYSKWNKLYITLPPPDAWGRTPLHEAAKEGHVDIVKLLIKSKANVNAQDEKGVTPLLLAGGNKNKSAFEDIVEILVKSGAEVNVKNNITGTTALFHAVIFKSSKAVTTLLNAGAWISENPSKESELHVAAGNSQLEILRMFLKDSRITLDDINKSDSCGRSPLCRAAYTGNKECVKILILHGANLSHMGKTKVTVLDIIFARLVRPAHFLRDVFDSRITGNDFEPTDEKYRVHLDFSILSPEGHDQQMDVISNILVAANETEKVKILQHPLIESFLRIKWAKIRQFFFFLIFSYTVFVWSLSVYVVLLIHYPQQFEVIRNVIQYLVIVTAGGLSGHAIIQCILIRRNFLNQYEIWLNLICLFLSLVVALSGTCNIDDGTIINSTPKWILHASSIAVLLAWTELMLLIGRFPTYGYYALMFAVVLQNVIKVLFIFVCLLIGFALSFSIQFHGKNDCANNTTTCEESNNQFNNPWRALVKTTVMMTGEFDYEDLFNSNNRLFATSRIIFLFFIILSSIVLMNLMVGLAVNDIQGVQQEGHARRLEKQAEFLRQLEQVISFKLIKSKWFPAIIKKYLKRKSGIPVKLTLDPHHGNSMSRGTKKKKLSCDLIESIVKVARSQQEENGDLSKNPRLRDLIEAMKVMIHRFERESFTS